MDPVRPILSALQDQEEKIEDVRARRLADAAELKELRRLVDALATQVAALTKDKDKKPK